MVGAVVGVDEEECLFVAEDVAAGVFAKHGGVAIDVQVIILQLKGEAEVLSEIVE